MWEKKLFFFYSGATTFQGDWFTQSKAQKREGEWEATTNEESLFRGGFWVRWALFFLVRHHHSTPWQTLVYTPATYIQFFLHRRFCWCFSLSLSPLQFLLFLFPFCCRSTSFWFCFFFFSLFASFFFRGEIIHQFLFSLHSCANNDRKKFCCSRVAAACAGVFKFSNGFLQKRKKEENKKICFEVKTRKRKIFRINGIGKLFWKNKRKKIKIVGGFFPFEI